MAQPFTHLRPVYLGDTDAAGVVYFNQLLQMCHETYEQWLDRQGLSVRAILAEGQWAVPVVRVEMDYLAPAQCGDRLEITLTPEWVKEYRFICHYQIFIQDSQISIARGQTHHVAIQLPERRPCPLPPAWQQALSSPFFKGG